MESQGAAVLMGTPTPYLKQGKMRTAPDQRGTGIGPWDRKTSCLELHANAALRSCRQRAGEFLWGPA